MIIVTKLNHSEVLLNSDLIEEVQQTADTVIMLSNGHTVRVRESVEQIRRKVVEFRRAIGLFCPAAGGSKAQHGGLEFDGHAEEFER